MHEAEQKVTRTDSERLAAIEVTLLNIEKRLFGNGQPGEMDMLNRRVSKLENWRWWLMGIGLGLGVAGGFGVSKLVEGLMR